MAAVSLLDADWGTDKPPRPTHDHNTHTGMCACGKNGTAEAHGQRVNDKGEVTTPAMSCREVLAIRERVARDITRESMSRWERLTSRRAGRGNDYTQEAYERAWVPARNPAGEGRAR